MEMTHNEFYEYRKKCIKNWKKNGDSPRAELLNKLNEIDVISFEFDDRNFLNKKDKSIINNHFLKEKTTFLQCKCLYGTYSKENIVSFAKVLLGFKNGEINGNKTIFYNDRKKIIFESIGNKMWLYLFPRDKAYKMFKLTKLSEINK